MNDLFSLAIIGCGLTGTSMLYQMIRMIRDKSKTSGKRSPLFRVVVFEQQNSMGPGLPYDKTNQFPFHIVNMEACDMSITADDPDNFSNWFTARKAGLKTGCPQLAQWFEEAGDDPLNKAFPPRMLMGKYLEDCFETALKQAENSGVQVSVKNGWVVTELTDQGEHMIITAVDPETDCFVKFFAERALLATGHWPGRPGRPGYFPSPWPAQTLLEQIPPGEKTAVIGTSLSAVDTALTLLSDGRFLKRADGSFAFMPADSSRQVTLFSRKGLLPKVRGSKKKRQNRFFSASRLLELIIEKKEALSLEDIFRLLDRELETAYGKPIDWDRVMHPRKDPATFLKEDIRLAKKGDNPDGDILWQSILFQDVKTKKQAYIHLSPAQKKQFDTQFKTIFMAHTAPMPLINAEKLLALMEAGVLSVRKLQKSFSNDAATESNGFDFYYTGPDGNMVGETFHFVVDARGQALSYETNPSVLAKNLLASGLVQIDNRTADTPEPPENLGLLIDPQTCGVMTGNIEKGFFVSSKLFAVGIMTQGQIINASMAKECVASTRKIAGYILSDHLEKNK